MELLRSRTGLWLAGLAVTIGLVIVTGISWVRLDPPPLGYDLLILREAGLRLRAEEPLYLDRTGERFSPGAVELYYGPPALAVAALPLTLIGGDQVRLLSFPLGLGTALASLGLMFGALRPRPGREQVAATITGALLSFAVLAGSTLGAGSILVLLLLSGTWACLSRRSDIMAGIILGTAAALRIYPVALLLPLVVAARWRVVAAAVVTTAAWTAVGVLVAGPGSTIEYVGLLLGLSSLDPPGNISFAAAAETLGLPEPLPRLVGLAAMAAGAALLVAGGRALGSGRHASAWPEAGAQRLVGWGVAIGGSLLVAPVVWDHYLTALLPLVVGLVALSGHAALGLLAVGFVPGLIGTLALVGIPVGGAISLVRARSR